MKNIKSFLNDFVRFMKNDEFFSGVKIIHAYPFNKKPERLDYPIVAVGFSQIRLKPKHIGSNIKSGEVSIFADIYVPSKMKTDCIYDIMCHICNAAGHMNASSVFCDNTEYYKKAEAYITKIFITFNSEVSFGGENGE